MNLWYKKIQKDFLNKKDTIIIPDFINVEELFIKLQQDKKLNLTQEDILEKTYYYKIIKGNYLTNEQIERIQDEHLEFYILDKNEKKQISEKIILKRYTKNILKNKKILDISTPLNDKDIDNFKYINKEAITRIGIDKFNKISEHEYFKNLIDIMNKLSNNDKTYQIEIRVTNRQILENSKLLNNVPKNIKLYINCNMASYTKEEFEYEERILNILIDPIKNSNLSPLEKYIAVYNIVKQFKEYKENELSPEQARILKKIINNECIVCGGFSILLQVMLQKINIPCDIIHVGIEDNTDKNNYSGHVRNIIKIDDDKYNIHGIYLADTTWDNNLKKDLYLNILLTHDEKKEAMDNEYLSEEDMLFDFHDFDEYNIKINTLLYKISQKSKEKKEQDRYAEAYIVVYKHILNHLKILDYQKYMYFYNKYNQKIYNTDNLKKQEQYAYAFLTEYGLYIIPLSNNKISKNIITKAALVTKKEIECMEQDELKQWKKETVKINKKYFPKAFPYIYDYKKEKETYLESRKR